MNKESYIVNPITKTKKFVHWLCELIVSFIFCFILVNFASIPAGKAIMKVDDAKKEVEEKSDTRMDILYGNKVLFYSNESEKSNFDKSILNTFNKYLSYYVVEEKNENEIFAHYFKQIKSNPNKYLELYSSINKNNPFFDINNEVITLKSNYIELFGPYFSGSDILSEEGKKQLQIFQNRVFTQLYSQMINDINLNDLTYNNFSYMELSKDIDSLTNTVNNTYLISTYIGYIVGLACAFIIVPLINSEHNTITSLFLNNVRISSFNFVIIKKRDIFIYFFYAIFLYSGMLFLAPVMHIGLTNAIALPSLLTVSIISLLFAVVSFFFSLFSDSGISLADYLSHTLLVSGDTLDEIERVRIKKR